MIKKIILLFTILGIYCTTHAQDITFLPEVAHGRVMPLPIESPWTSTDVYIDSGDSVTIVMNGIAATANWTNDLHVWVGPEGEPGLYQNGLLNHGVIGKIGSSGTPFNVGRSYHFVSLKSDTLYLGYSDDYHSDNYGYYLAYINKTGRWNPTAVNDYFNTIPSMFNVKQNYPNPFNPSTTIEYQIVKQGNVEVAIYDINGRLVKTIVNETQYPGSYTLQWNSRDEAGANVSSGTYFYQVNSNGVQLVKKMLLLK